MSFNEYESNGRKLLVQYTCLRCGKTRIEPVEKMVPRDGHYGFLHNLRHPDGWGEFYNRLLCDTCTSQLHSFLANKDQKAEGDLTP